MDSFLYTWANNEPDNKDDAERCVALNCDGKLSDVRCDKPRPYICYRPNSTKGAGICGTTDPGEHNFRMFTNFQQRQVYESTVMQLLGSILILLNFLLYMHIKS